MFIRQLNYLVALANERHFGRAAAACHVSQPALSGAIRSIEEELGISIVRRGRRFEGFTPDGERVLTWARRVLADCDALRQVARNGQHGPEGVLRMGAIPAALPLVPRLTESCLDRFPRMRHEVVTLPATDVQRRLRDFEIDVGLTYLDDERLRAGFTAMPVFRERYVLVAADVAMFRGAQRMSWRDAAALPLCLFTTSMQCRQGIDAAFAEAGVQAAPVLETDSMTVLCSHVRRTGLFSILPHSALSLGETSGWLPAILMTPELNRDIGLVVLDRMPRGSLVDAALDVFGNLDLQSWMDGLLV